MKSLALVASLTLTAITFSVIGSPASADPLSALESFTLGDVKQGEAVYAANPTVATYAAATQCLSWEDATLSSLPAGTTLGAALLPPKGIVSTIADLDVAVNTANAGLPKIVLDFNGACGGYIEDLKAEAAATAARSFLPFGLHL